MFDSFFSASSIGQFGLGPSSESFPPVGISDNLFTNSLDDEMTLSGPPAASETISMASHRSLWTSSSPNGLKRSLSSAGLSSMAGAITSEFSSYNTSKKTKRRAGGDLKKMMGSVDEGEPEPKVMGLHSSSSCPNLNALDRDEEEGGAPDSTDKIKKRKARKAEVARQCRKRKKAYIQSLEEKAKALADQLTAMSQRGAGVSRVDAESQHRQEQQGILAKIQRFLSKPQSYDTNKELRNCISAFANKSRKRQRVNASEIQGLKRSLSLEVDTKFALWLLQQGGKFCNSDLWRDLLGELKLSKTQVNKLNSNRNRAFELRQELVNLNRQVDALQKEIGQHLQKRHTVIDYLTNKVLNPKQTATLLVWVQNNPSCMGVLDTVWKKQAAEKKKVRRVQEGQRGPSTRRTWEKTEDAEPPIELLPTTGPLGTELESNLGSHGLLSTNEMKFDSGQKGYLGKDMVLSSLEGFIGDEPQ